MAILTDVGEELLLEYLFKRTGSELCLAINPDLTECTDEAYSRIDLSDYLGSVSDGFITNNVSFTFDTGTEVVSYWFIVDPVSGDPVAYDVLPSPQVGEFRFPAGALRLEAISG
jgi:hypothetical protein